MAYEGTFDEEQLPDGVYISLPEPRYFGQKRYGSSDWIKLWLHREGWWWQSRFNPKRKPGQTDAQNYGSALHVLLLEGRHRYETQFVVEPDPLDYPKALRSTDDIKAALRDRSIDLKGTSGFKKQDWCDAAVLHLPDLDVWDNIVGAFNKTREIRSPGGELIGHKPAVSALEDFELRLMLEAAEEDEEVRAYLGIGQDVPSLAELSFFWTDDLGHKRRARFDKPVPTFTLDLKSLGNWQGRELRHAVGDHILRGGYDIQVADQHDARRRMLRMIAEQGEACITGGTLEERAWLIAMAQRMVKWDWVWLFYQKPELSGRAPVVFPLRELWRGPYHVSGHRKAYKSARFLSLCIDRFGLDDIPASDGRAPRPWSRIEPTHYTDENMEPRITKPHYGWDEDRVDDEEEAFER